MGKQLKTVKALDDLKKLKVKMFHTPGKMRLSDITEAHSMNVLNDREYARLRNRSRKR